MIENGPVRPGDLFFFYGLLKQGAVGSPDHIDLQGGGEFLRPAFVRGVLYDLGTYPGLRDGEGQVSGLLYRLNDVSLVPLLDEFEDVVPADIKASLYVRTLKPVLDKSGNPMGETAWVYEYNQPVRDFPRIEDGNWPLEKGMKA